MPVLKEKEKKKKDKIRGGNEKGNWYLSLTG